MKILMEYGVGLQKDRILQHYWYHLSIVDIKGRYYSSLFKVHQGVTHGDLLSLTIFTMMVDAVIRHWVAMVEVDEAVLDRFVWEVQCLAVFFYADEELITSPRPAQIQSALDVLTGLFGVVVLYTNVDKMVGMLFQPF